MRQTSPVREQDEKLPLQRKRQDVERELVYTLPPAEEFAHYKRVHLIILLISLSLLFSASTGYFVLVKQQRLQAWLRPPAVVPVVSRINFGSCLQFRVGDQPVWKAVISLRPDTWIWAGDFIYFDLPFDICTGDPEDPEECFCAAKNVSYPPFHCNAGNIAVARRKVLAQMQQEEYLAFLRYACQDTSEHAIKPTYVGPQCSAKIIGIYDDHDFGWNNGNGKLQDKLDYKRLFLDAIGESPSSPRRWAGRGAEDVTVLNEHDPHKRIAVHLLDERYYRDPLPCAVRKIFCENYLEDLTNNKTHKSAASLKGYCEDFLSPGGCCEKDNLLFSEQSGWCHQSDATESEFFQDLCNTSSPVFGSRPLRFDKDKRQFFSADTYWPSSHFCEVLGSAQRHWLEDSLSTSDAVLNIIVSPSVIFHDPDGCVPEKKGLDLDTYECYPVARTALLESIARSGASCSVIITGDFHYADIKVLSPENAEAVKQYVPSGKLTYPLYQVMASGMTDEVVLGMHHGNLAALNGSSVKSRLFPLAENDAFHLRVHDSKGYTTKANFGGIDFDWDQREAKLQILEASSGKTLIEQKIDLDACARGVVN